jgi:hypothetical protein
MDPRFGEIARAKHRSFASKEQQTVDGRFLQELLSVRRDNSLSRQYFSFFEGGPCEVLSAHVERSKKIGEQFGEQLCPNTSFLARKRFGRAELSSFIPSNRAWDFDTLLNRCRGQNSYRGFESIFSAQFWFMPFNWASEN